MSDTYVREAITDHIYRYCRAVDRLDIALGHSIFHPDGTADYGDYYNGPGPGVIDLICANHRGLLHHSHQVSNILIEVNGETAGSESYCTASLRLRKGEKILHMMVWSRYVDSWSWRHGRWALDHRIAIRDFDEMREVTPMQQHEIGSRDHNDPSYKVLRSTT
jgi:hypothetical protein